MTKLSYLERTKEKVFDKYKDSQKSGDDLISSVGNIFRTIASKFPMEYDENDIDEVLAAIYNYRANKKIEFMDQLFEKYKSTPKSYYELFSDLKDEFDSFYLGYDSSDIKEVINDVLTYQGEKIVNNSYSPESDDFEVFNFMLFANVIQMIYQHAHDPNTPKLSSILDYLEKSFGKIILEILDEFDDKLIKIIPGDNQSYIDFQVELYNVVRRNIRTRTSVFFKQILNFLDLCQNDPSVGVIALQYDMIYYNINSNPLLDEPYSIQEKYLSLSSDFLDSEVNRTFVYPILRSGLISEESYQKIYKTVGMGGLIQTSGSESELLVHNIYVKLNGIGFQSTSLYEPKYGGTLYHHVPEGFEKYNFNPVDDPLCFFGALNHRLPEKHKLNDREIASILKNIGVELDLLPYISGRHILFILFEIYHLKNITIELSVRTISKEKIEKAKEKKGSIVSNLSKTYFKIKGLFENPNKIYSPDYKIELNYAFNHYFSFTKRGGSSFIIKNYDSFIPMRPSSKEYQEKIKNDLEKIQKIKDYVYEESDINIINEIDDHNSNLVLSDSEKPSAQTEKKNKNKLEQKDGSFVVFYDLECSTNGQHVPYGVGMIICIIENGDIKPISKTYLNLKENEKIDPFNKYLIPLRMFSYIEKVVMANDVNLQYKEFMKKLAGKNNIIKEKKQPKPDVYMFAHNGNSYDNLIVRNCLIPDKDINVGPTRIVESKCFHKTMNIYFRDTLQLIPKRISDFPKMFGFPEKNKELMPYEFFNGAYPFVKKYNLKDQMDRTEFRKEVQKYFTDKKDRMEFYNTIKNKFDGIFDPAKYSEYYCMIDVEIMFKGFLKFREFIKDLTQLDVLNYLTISSLSMDYLKLCGGFDQTAKITGVIRNIAKKCIEGGKIMVHPEKKKHINKNYSEISKMVGKKYSELSSESVKILNEAKDDMMVDFDAVSLYPSCMSKILMPCGKMDFIKSEISEVFDPKKSKDPNDHKYGFWYCEFIEPKKEITYPIKSKIDDSGRRVYVNQKFENIWVDTQQLVDLVHLQNAEFKILKGIYFEGRTSKVKEAIDHLFETRKKLKSEGNPLQEVVKLIMNSCYGKTIMKEQKVKFKYLSQDKLAGFYDRHKVLIENVEIMDNPRIPVYKIRSIENKFTEEMAEGSGSKPKLEFVTQSHSELLKKLESSKRFYKCYAWKEFNRTFKHVMCRIRMKRLDHNSDQTFHHYGCCILSGSKHLMNNMMQTIDDSNIYYMDTDSNHMLVKDLNKLVESKPDLIGKNLGQFHSDFEHPDLKPLEGYDYLTAMRSVFVGKKFYIDELIGLDSEDKIAIRYHKRAKGINAGILSFDDYLNLLEKGYKYKISTSGEVEIMNSEDKKIDAFKSEIHKKLFFKRSFTSGVRSEERFKTVRRTD